MFWWVSVNEWGTVGNHGEEMTDMENEEMLGGGG
jgi:hypothetical protein